MTAIAQGLKQAARGLKLGDLQILLENTAGQGTSSARASRNCAPFWMLRPICRWESALTRRTLLPRDGICAPPQGLEKTLQAMDRTVGLDRVAVVHVNDSKTHVGSRVDRHEHIGKGKIGLEAFGRILNHPLLAGRAFILETPIDKPGDDRRNVAALWKLLGRVVTATGEGMKPRPHRSKVKRATEGQGRES